MFLQINFVLLASLSPFSYEPHSINCAFSSSLSCFLVSFARSKQVLRSSSKIVCLHRVHPTSIIEQRDAFLFDIVYQRHTIWEIQRLHCIFRNRTKMHENSTDGILVTANEDPLPLIHGLRHNALGVKWNCSLHAIPRRFPLGKLSMDLEVPRLDAAKYRLNPRDTQILHIFDTLVIISGIRQRVRRHWWRSHAYPTAPLLELLLPILLGDHLFALPRERSVHPFVEPPALDHWKPRLIELIDTLSRCVDGTKELGSVHDVEFKSVTFEQPSTVACVLHALGREGGILPSGEKA
mmetsp:Transcript_32314/g.62305  ORF Transcript_32314/g.62305 Transcript_32314/m.62305 type:complete len:294 (+) Transcript_32314:116-997(+)